MQHYVMKFVNDLRQVGGFLRVLRFLPPIKLTATIYLKIVESGVKYHNPNPNPFDVIGRRFEKVKNGHRFENWTPI